MRSFTTNKAPAMTADRIYIINKLVKANPHLISSFACSGQYEDAGGTANFPSVLFEVQTYNSRGDEKVRHKLCGLFGNDTDARTAMVGFSQQYGGQHDRTFLIVRFYDGKLHAMEECVYAETPQCLAAPEQTAAA